GVAVDGEGNAYVTGFTGSNDFPTSHALQPVNGGPNFFTSTNQAGGWMGSGLNNLGVTSLAMDPTNPLIIYAGTGRTGVFKTTDGGVQWTAVNAGLTNLLVTAL